MTEPMRQWAGDFLLLFNPASSIPSARGGAAWTLAHQGQGGCLYVSPTTINWRGAPLTHWQDGGRRYWLIGEIWGNLEGSDPVDWPGHFALLALDEATKHWHLWTNRCGTFHVYLGNGNSATALGTYSPAVAAVNAKTLDVEALAGFFSFGFFPSNRTHYKEVEIIRPRTHLVLDDCGQIIKQERTWQWHHQPAPGLTFDQAVDQFAEICNQVISEQVKDRRVAFPISGGLDSRSTIAALPGEGNSSKPWCFSYGYSDDSIENRIAKKISSTRGLPYHSYTIRPYLFDALPMVMDSVEGFQDITQCRQAYIIDELASHADYVMAAHWGDVWLDDMGILEHPETDLVEFATSKFHKNSDWLIQHIIQPLAPNLDVPAYLCETLESELPPFDSIADPDFKLKAFKTELWSFRWTTASIRMYQPGSFPLLPFYDPRLVEFFCTIPTSYVAGRRLQIEYLKRYAPDLARIPWQVFDANLYWYRYFNSLLIPKRAVNKLQRTLSRKQIIQRNWEVQFLSPGGREKLENHLLGEGLKIHKIVSLEEIRKLMLTFFAVPSPANGYTISMLLTFTAWLERHG